MLLYPMVVVVLTSKNVRLARWHGKEVRSNTRKKEKLEPWWVTLFPVVVLWVITIGAPRLRYDPGTLLPPRMPPTTAWLVLALNNSAVVSCASVGKVSLLHSLLICGTIVLTVCVVTVLELSHVSTDPWGLVLIVLSGLFMSRFVVVKEKNAQEQADGTYKLYLD